MGIFDIAGAGFPVTVFLGLVFGSFATALSYRLPRGLSIVTVKRSLCPSCKKQLGVWYLIPLFSWLFLKGRCRYCRSGIGRRYPLIELATLALCLVFYSVYGFRPETLPILFLAPLIISIIDIDLHHKIIPDGLNLSIVLVGMAVLGINAFLQENGFLFLMEKGGEALGGAAVYGLGSLLLRQVAMVAMKREPMGLGDIIFFAAAGFWMGWNVDAAALFLFVAGVSGVGLALLWKKVTGEVEFPFGPSLAVAFVSALCFYPPAFVAM